MSDRGEPLFEIGPYVGWPSADGQVYYEEVASNGEVLNVSEEFTTREHAGEGAQAALDRARES